MSRRPALHDLYSVEICGCTLGVVMTEVRSYTGAAMVYVTTLFSPFAFVMSVYADEGHCI